MKSFTRYCSKGVLNPLPKSLIITSYKFPKLLEICILLCVKKEEGWNRSVSRIQLKEILPSDMQEQP